MPEKNEGFFSGLFDFNGDGETDPGEEWIAFNIFNEVTKEDEDDIFYDADEEEDDNLEIDPEAFDDEYDYSEALEDL
ncbi:MAG TPA: hypothetical protein GX704_04300 [Clostridiales bacterium]|jgi:hypothetical protein|nr:hypothetical protein [Clostridiales bacterium]